MATIYDPAPAPTPVAGNYGPVFGSMGGGGGGSMFGGSMFGGAALQPYTQSKTLTGQGQGNTAIQGLLQNLVKGTQDQQSQYLSQYKNLLGSVDQTRQNVEGQFNQLGQQGNQQINNQMHTQMGHVNASAAGRGLGNTTILNGLQNGVTQTANMAHTDLNSQIAGQKAGAEMGLGNMQGNAIQQLGQNPMLGLYQNLLQSLMGSGSLGGIGSAVSGAINGTGR